jgi:inosine/xanthosine triphosphatase
MKVALGSDRTAKVMAVRAALARIASVDSGWSSPRIISRAVSTTVPSMPLTDAQLMQGARERAEAIRDLLSGEGRNAQIYIGLEGGFHSISVDGVWHTFLRGWAYATDGEAASHYGSSPSISVPDEIVRSVVYGRRELGDIIDQVAGENDVRSRQGAWGVLSRDLLTRSMSFESALIGALAPFYNAKVYD